MAFHWPIKEKINMKSILHISNHHSSFDDRIFYKELVSLSPLYKCCLISGGNSNGELTTMGGDTVSAGMYKNVTIMPFPDSVSRNIIMRILRKFFNPLYRALYNYICFIKITNICKSNDIKPDIIHFHDLDFFPTVKKIKTFFECKLIFDCHEFYFSYYFQNRLSYGTLKKAAKSIMILKQAVRSSDYVISVTKNLDNIISLIMKSDNHSIIYNSSLFPTRGALELPGNKICLVHEGAMSFNRGLRLMLELFTDEYFRNNVKLKIIGSLAGAEKIFFNDFCKEYKIDHTMVEVTGWIPYEKLPDYLSGNIGIIFFEKTFNTYYGMPNKLFNYINASMPILATHCAESSEFIETNKIGCIVERDIDSIKTGLKELAANYSFFQKNIQNIQNAVSWETEKTKLLGIYKNLLGE
jgi:glycosyltransferase involved in cell wall biosynthesis